MENKDMLIETISDDVLYEVSQLTILMKRLYIF